MRRFSRVALCALLAGCSSSPIDGSTDGTIAPIDLAVPPPDLAQVGCNPPCPAAAPVCNAARQCVVCVADSDCPAGRICKTGNVGPTCVPGCTTDDRCG